MKSGVRPVLKGKVLPLAAGLGLLASPGFANGVPDTEARLASLETARSAQSAGDNAWMLVCAALVLMMTGPGLALFYGGLVRRKNVLGTMMQSFIMMAVVTVIWAVVGYSLAFSGSGSFLGNLDAAFLSGVGSTPNPDYAATIPQQTFMVYLECGNLAAEERVQESALSPHHVSHRRVDEQAPQDHEQQHGGALYLGKRVGFPAESMKPHNLVISFIGACLLWVGWFGFNAGSALGASGLATSAFVATHFGAAAATIGWLLAEWLHNGKPSVLGGISGCVAGLVAITPASGFVKPFPAMLIGLCAGVFCYFMVVKAKRIFGYDDSLDAFGVHGAGGTLGAVLTGVFATNAINDALKNAAGQPQALGLVDGNAGQIVNQVIGAGIAWALAIVGTLVILKICDATIGLRVNQDQEVEGLDVTQHGEEGYNFEA